MGYFSTLTLPMGGAVLFKTGEEHSLPRFHFGKYYSDLSDGTYLGSKLEQDRTFSYYLVHCKDGYVKEALFIDTHEAIGNNRIQEVASKIPRIQEFKAQYGVHFDDIEWYL